MREKKGEEVVRRRGGGERRKEGGVSVRLEGEGGEREGGGGNVKMEWGRGRKEGRGGTCQDGRGRGMEGRKGGYLSRWKRRRDGRKEGRVPVTMEELAVRQIGREGRSHMGGEVWLTDGRVGTY